jgi:hypothetical protein
MNFPDVPNYVNETKLKNVTQHITTQYPVLSEAKNVPVFNASNKSF